MNWVIVIFDELRTVYVHGKPLGDTNVKLVLGEDGTYTFDLGKPRDYEPPKVTTEVSGATYEHPKEIKFYKLGASL